MQVFSSILQKVGFLQKTVIKQQNLWITFSRKLNIYNVNSIGRHLYTLIISKTIHKKSKTFDLLCFFLTEAVWFIWIVLILPGTVHTE